MTVPTSVRCEGCSDERHPGRADAVGAGSGAGPRADVRSRADAARAGALARALAAGAGLVGGKVADAAGARRAHDRELARGVRPRRPGRPGLRADGRSPPALDAGGPGRAEGGGAGDAGGGRHRPGELELEGGAPVRRGALRGPPRPQRLHALPAPAGLRLQAPEEAAAQGRRGQAGGLRGGVRRPAGWRRGRRGAKIFFVDEAHFCADADLRGKWVLKGEPALVDSTSPRWGEKASYYSAVCLETGEVEHMELGGNSSPRPASPSSRSCAPTTPSR